MALKATIYKAELVVSDMDRNHYATYPLTIAQHPSETLQRMMVRLVMFALYADEHLEFTKGLSTDDEPDLLAQALTGYIDPWIELGQPDDKRLRKASHKAKQLVLCGYQGNAFDVWWKNNANACRQIPQLTVLQLDDEIASQLEGMVERTMRLQANIQDGTLWFGNNEQTLEITPTRLQAGTSS